MHTRPSPSTVPGPTWSNRRSKSAFPQIARTFLRHIRVASLGELRLCILLGGFGVMKAQSVRFQWQNVDVQMTESANY